MKKMLLIAVFIFLAFAQAWRCERNILGPPPELTENFLQSTPDTLHLGNQSLVLRTYLWRDFMPIIPPGGNPLYGVIKIETVDSSAISEDINSDGLYIVYNHEVWRFNYDEEPPPDHPDQKPFRLLKFFRRGPKLNPRIYVDVIARINVAGEQHYLRASEQYIGATF